MRAVLLFAVLIALTKGLKYQLFVAGYLGVAFPPLLKQHDAGCAKTPNLT